MSPLLWLLAAQAAVSAPAAPVENQTVMAVEVVTEGEPMAERRVERREPFQVQRVVIEAGIVFDITPAALDALRERYELDRTAPFVLSEWAAIGPEPNLAVRHIGLVHCARRLRYMRSPVKTCLRDGDGDGRLDGAATFRTHDMPGTALRFEPIEPIPYHYVPAARTGTEGLSEVGLGFGWDRVGDSGRLRFFAQAASNFRAEIDPSVEVDPAQLPATIEIAGAQLTIISYDGRRSVVRVDRPFPSRLVRLTSMGGASDNAAILSIMGGTGHHWRLEYPDFALPGAP